MNRRIAAATASLAILHIERGMASVRPQSAALFCAVALLATACSAAAQAAGAATTLANLPKLQHPVGSGLNKAQPLGLKPQRGKLFQKTMQEFVAAARAGNLELAQQIQQRLFQITGPKGHRRALQQVVRPPAALVSEKRFNHGKQHKQTRYTDGTPGRCPR